MDTELTKLAFQLGYQHGLQKQAQIREGVKNFVFANSPALRMIGNLRSKNFSLPNFVNDLASLSPLGFSLKTPEHFRQGVKGLRQIDRGLAEKIRTFGRNFSKSYDTYSAEAAAPAQNIAAPSAAATTSGAPATTNGVPATTNRPTLTQAFRDSIAGKQDLEFANEHPFLWALGRPSPMFPGGF